MHFDYGQPKTPDVKPKQKPTQVLEQQIQYLEQHNQALREKLVSVYQENAELREELNKERTRTSQAADQAYAVGYQNARLEKCHGCDWNFE